MIMLTFSLLFQFHAQYLFLSVQDQIYCHEIYLRGKIPDSRDPMMFLRTNMPQLVFLILVYLSISFQNSLVKTWTLQPEKEQSEQMDSSTYSVQQKKGIRRNLKNASVINRSLTSLSGSAYVIRAVYKP